MATTFARTARLLVALSYVVKVSVAFSAPKLSKATFGSGCFCTYLQELNRHYVFFSFLIMFVMKDLPLTLFSPDNTGKPSEDLLNVDGVEQTIVGYTGVSNYKKAPDYDAVCFGRQWVEGVRVYYDESQISYPELLEKFFETQNPKLTSRQYASIIFCHDEEQKQAAEEWLRTPQVREDGVTKDWTTVEDATPFFQAESYHQNYWPKTRGRVAVLVGLLAVASGRFDSVAPLDLSETISSGCNALALAGLIFVAAERGFDKSTQLLED